MILKQKAQVANHIEVAYKEGVDRREYSNNIWSSLTPNAKFNAHSSVIANLL